MDPLGAPRMTLPFGLGALRAAAPALLPALLATPLFLATARRARLAGLCRTLAAALLVLALAGVRLERTVPAAGACIVAAIDVSASVGAGARDTAADFLERLLPALDRRDVVGSVAFAGRARVVAHPAAGRVPLAGLLPEGSLDALEPGETDLAAALARAGPLCPEGRQAAVVLFTDGNETVGSALAEAALTEPRVPVFPVVPAPARLPAASVRRLVAPALAPAHAALPIEAVVESRAAEPRAAALRIAVDGQSLLPVPVELTPGVSVVRLPYRFEAPGSRLLEAELLLPPGEPPSPGPVARVIGVTSPVRVLVVSERERPAAALALARRGMDVELTAPAGLAARAARLADYHLVVLDDVARAGVPDGAVAALAARVAAGGGLVVTGGAHLFGDAGWVGTPLARVLPVALRSQRPEPKERDPIALYLLIDRSNSMGYASGPQLEYGAKMEYAKRAALAVLDQLGPRDLVGAIAFDSQPYELGRLLPLAEARAALAAKIRQLRYGGGTDFKDALATARRSLLAAGQRVRHVILLTDGDTNRRAEDHDELIAELARDEITVTAIRIGSDTVNLDLLDRIARATGGFFHHVEDVQALPQLMISDTQHLVNAAANRREAPARLGDPGAALAGIAEDELPPVAGWAVTEPRPDAEVRLWVDDGVRRDPLLATWQYELGRVAAVPMDFQAGAAAWPTWRGFAKLWSQLATWAATRALASARRLEARPARDGTLVRLETAADEPGPFALRVDGREETALRPTGARTFGAHLPALTPGVHAAMLVVAGREEPVELVVVPRAPSERELRADPPDVALLARLADATGGRVAPEPADVLAARPGVERRALPLEPVLIALALALVLGDVAMRTLGRPGARGLP
jgi:Mg-chelatase subunit ChlD